MDCAAASGRAVKKAARGGQQLPCRYCTLSLCWTLWRRSSDSVPYTADTNVRNRWRLPDSNRCHTGIEQVNAKHNRANRNSLSSAIENRVDDNSDIGFARLCFCSVVPTRGTHKSPKIVCSLWTHHVECSKLGKTQIIKDVRRGMVRNTGFCD